MELADTLREQMRRHRVMPWLCELAAFLCGHDPKLYSPLVDVLTESFTKWAERKREEVQQLGTTSRSSHAGSGDSSYKKLWHEQRALQAQEALFRGYAVLCRFDGPLSPAVVGEMCANFAIVHCRVQTCVDTDDFRLLQHVYTWCVEIFTRRLRDLKAVMSDAALTQAILVVLGGSTVGEDVQQSLRWTRSGCIYEAVGGGRLFSLNLATGCVLCDGEPPSSLPASVLLHKKFQRTFGERNFEITKNDRGEMETTMPTRSCRCCENSRHLNTSAGLELLREQRESWEKSERVEAKRVEVNLPPLVVFLSQRLRAGLQRASAERQKVERLLLNCLLPAEGPLDSSGENLIAFSFLQLAGLRARPRPLDFLRSSFDKTTLTDLNPFLSEEEVEMVWRGCIKWMRLCSLEDKHRRLIFLCEAGDGARVTDELNCMREWDPEVYPYWLAFEVQQAIMIRPKQARVAKTLIETPGAITQLNMGEGKTRVILPMLLLHFTAERSHLVRAHFLPSLLPEAWRFFQETLQASPTFLMPFFQLPYFRQLEIPHTFWSTVRQTLEDCVSSGGCLFVTPEHRLSLQLKHVEAGLRSGEESEATSKFLGSLLDSFLESDRVIDLLDESDAILHHKYQLVYACGLQMPLPEGRQRWVAAQAIFRVLGDLTRHRRVKDVLERDEMSSLNQSFARASGTGGLVGSSIVRNPPKYPGSFFFFLLNPIDLPAFEQNASELRREIFKAIIDDPPYELKWLRVLHGGLSLDEYHRALLTGFVISPDQSSLTNLPPS
uniref:ubiquitinyl hydrolase 1 n=1 Tax=Chromera velia CCMP2878 TaxID=1169474 RepID=A0A0G4FVD6_9ALVE|eukprot:Cvel_18872.t1-p1 / transcript=Cvel_18872.t1 / gene=Cvel_18872 / organism=Chromera_velia_CCMP2878 / gene_product=hypothetical protein / transcript_product=hypothetical protein / location=Cvel_scaffold1589:8064-11049(+) / protein_length=776 / sequence_SO=supercontig / SO=protein_coding / is_pseudo=false